MRLASFFAFATGGILLLGPISSVWAQDVSGGPSRGGWHLGGGIGPNWAADLDQEGWNRETTCYPTAACFDADPVPEISGYRWRYDIASAAGSVFEISAGRIFDRTRLELSFAQRKNGLGQMFRSITDYDGVPMEDRRNDSVVSNSRASIDHFTVRTLALNAYYDFPDVYRGISPYLGLGAGSRVHQGVRGVFLHQLRGHIGQCSSLRSSPVVLQQPPGRRPLRSRSWAPPTCTPGPDYTA